MHALIWSKVQRLSLLHIEGLVPAVHIPHDAVDSLRVGAMEIRFNLSSPGVWAYLASPHLSPTKKDSLVARDAVITGAGLSFRDAWYAERASAFAICR